MIVASGNFQNVSLFCVMMMNPYYNYTFAWALLLSYNNGVKIITYSEILQCYSLVIGSFLARYASTVFTTCAISSTILPIASSGTISLIGIYKIYMKYLNLALPCQRRSTSFLEIDNVNL